MKTETVPFGLDVGNGIAALWLVFDHRLIGEVVSHDRPVLGVECPSDRVEFDKVESAAWIEQLCHHLGPPVDVVEPCERTFAGIDDVIGLAECRDGIVDIGPDPPRRYCTGVGNLGGLIDCGLREVQAGNVKTATGPRNRIRSNVALEMDEGVGLTDLELSDLKIVKQGDAVLEFVNLVERGPGVQRCALIPPTLVRLHVVV